MYTTCYVNIHVHVHYMLCTYTCTCIFIHLHEYLIYGISEWDFIRLHVAQYPLGLMEGGGINKTTCTCENAPLIFVNAHPPLFPTCQLSAPWAFARAVAVSWSKMHELVQNLFSNPKAHYLVSNAGVLNSWNRGKFVMTKVFKQHPMDVFHLWRYLVYEWWIPLKT